MRKFFMTFARIINKMPEFYMMFARKICFQILFFWGGGMIPLPRLLRLLSAP